MLYLLGGWAGSLVALFLWMKADKAIEIRQVKKEQTRICDTRVQTTKDEISAAGNKQVEEARAAGRSLPDTSNLAKLCKGSASCRDK